MKTESSTVPAREADSKSFQKSRPESGNRQPIARFQALRCESGVKQTSTRGASSAATTYDQRRSL